ncbi:MAG: DUF4384 domain-containing protein [Gemmatimonadota bacterium]
MTVYLAIGLGLLAQTAAPTAPIRAARSDVPPVRVWLPDTTVSVGEPARVYVALRDTSHLMVLHVDPSGRIRVLFPRHPGDPDLVPGGETFGIAGIEEGLTFRVPGPGTGTILAVRSSARTPFRFDGLTVGNDWDYDNALLLQPTGGNPFAAMLDIADRIANGEAYNYDLAGYRTPGAMATRRLASDTVCFSCLAARHSGSTGQADDGMVNSAIAIDHSYAAAPGGTVVDCSSSTLVDSFCGVQDNSVATTVQESTTYASTSYVEPVYTPFFFPFRRFRRMQRAPALPPPAIALNLRRIPGRVVPPPPRRPPRIEVQQPRAPSHPIAAPVPESASPQMAPAAAAAASRSIVHRNFAAAPRTYQPAAAASGWRSGTAGSPAPAAAPRATVPPAPGGATAGAQAARPMAVPARSVTRGYANPRD